MLKIMFMLVIIPFTLCNGASQADHERLDRLALKEQMPMECGRLNESSDPKSKGFCALSALKNCTATLQRLKNPDACTKAQAHRQAGMDSIQNGDDFVTYGHYMKCITAALVCREKEKRSEANLKTQENQR